MSQGSISSTTEQTPSANVDIHLRSLRRRDASWNRLSNVNSGVRILFKTCVKKTQYVQLYIAGVRLQ